MESETANVATMKDVNLLLMAGNILRELRRSNERRYRQLAALHHESEVPLNVYFAAFMGVFLFLTWGGQEFDVEEGVQAMKDHYGTQTGRMKSK